MQDLHLVLDYVMAVAFITFYGTVTWSLFRYSTRKMYRYWALGWVVYTIGAFVGVIISSDILVITDVFPLAAMYCGGTLIVDGSLGKQFTRKRSIMYILGVAILHSLLIIGLFFSWPFYLVFIPLGLQLINVCFRSAKTVYEIEEPVGQPKYWLMIGLATWGISWILFPIVAIIPEFYLVFMVIQAVGVLVSGASMLTLFMRTVTLDLERQHRVTQIISGLVQHDIRNYIQVAKLSLELIDNLGISNDHWIDVASDALDGAKDFVEEMRRMTYMLAREKIRSEPVVLLDVIQSVGSRVVSEYSLNPDQIRVQVSEDTKVLTCPLAKELLWNIFDNAFKHKSDILIVNQRFRDNSSVDIEIIDHGGGLPDDMKNYLNDPISFSEQTAPGLGLGVLLIQGLSAMCGARIHVEDAIEGSMVIGTRYSLTFRIAK
ncbi:MAG: HAMP domain-containing histidine kinase [Candidatus Thorarchaeota archaeon]|nr:HAMP domain-containing histidine kinase [Candidatus Thorarchaeota archaeon]